MTFKKGDRVRLNANGQAVFAGPFAGEVMVFEPHDPSGNTAYPCLRVHSPLKNNEFIALSLSVDLWELDRKE